jgi:S-adenosylmethionine:tRNA ribosyltransferase-isomerase
MITAPATTSDFDFDLPPDRIAQQPAERRDLSRLMVLHREGPSHHQFHEFPDLITALCGEKPLLVVNDTRVIPARLRGRKPTGGQVELLLCDPLLEEGALQDPGPGDPEAWQETWRCLYRASKPLRPGDAVLLAGPDAPRVSIVRNEGGGKVVARFSGRGEGGLLAALERHGEVPLPPYIERSSAPSQEDRLRYQTVYAAAPGAVAAPTAGLHFTQEVLAALWARGVQRVAVTLHVGPGTFAPIQTEDLSAHVMHTERYHVPQETAASIAAARRAGRRVIAVGTTVVRALESATPEGAAGPRPGWAETQIFIHPPYRFRAVDALLTNFHLPRSTLLMLVSAFAGRRRVLAAYAEAVRAGYRFFSYGDAMFIPAPYHDEE